MPLQAYGCQPTHPIKKPMLCFKLAPNILPKQTEAARQSSEFLSQQATSAEYQKQMPVRKDIYSVQKNHTYVHLLNIYASRTLSIDMQWHSSGWSVTKLEMLEGILDGAVYVPWSSQGYSWGKHHSMKWSSADHDLASTIQWFELWRAAQFGLGSCGEHLGKREGLQLLLTSKPFLLDVPGTMGETVHGQQQPHPLLWAPRTSLCCFSFHGFSDELKLPGRPPARRTFSGTTVLQR
ncbi:uncharacterized protein [Patagioenas fasciata]|uniref:uncharacterized protein isoform X3 n=1 Tax=Patagioenas fasciata TaxID=372321 RepID=UPI003A99323D